jgi:hopanoid biosynthesis associated protein HpnK
MSLRRLIVNADDFGRSSSINNAVIHAHREGILTTASLMVNGDAFDEAVALARANPMLGVGLHLTLACGRSTLPWMEIPTLVNQQNEFTDNPVEAGMQYFFQKAARWHLEKEIEAQFAKFAQTGLTMDHLNGHLHFHLHPTILKILEPLFAKYNVRAVRLTHEPWEIDFNISSGNRPYRISHAIVFSLLSRSAKTVFHKHRVKHTDHVFGLLQNARVSTDYLSRLIPTIPSGDSELYSHPSLDEFKHEYEALISPKVRGLVEQHKIELIRYQDL